LETISADEIAWMVGDHQVRLALRKGTMVIFDKSVSHLVRHMIFGTFAPTHSQNIAPTAHGNLILGIRYVETDHKGDTKVSRGGHQSQPGRYSGDHEIGEATGSCHIGEGHYHQFFRNPFH
jgi:hypothetical protein